MKVKLYIDFDGVILNTIDVTYKMIDELNIKSATERETFYKNLNWEDLLENSPIIKDSINNIKKLIKSNLYDVNILSHINSKKEELAKKRYLKKYIPNLKVITINIKINKCDAVDCKNAILVDDYMKNLELWNKKSGIPIKFSDKGKTYKYITINSLDMLLDKYEEIVSLINAK